VNIGKKGAACVRAGREWCQRTAVAGEDGEGIMGTRR
jgi:hypothetical protein